MLCHVHLGPDEAGKLVLYSRCQLNHRLSVLFHLFVVVYLATIEVLLAACLFPTGTFKLCGVPLLDSHTLAVLFFGGIVHTLPACLLELYVLLCVLEHQVLHVHG